MDDKKDLEKEIRKEMEKSGGWDDFEILCIEKYGNELCVKTDQGDVFVSVRDLFEQYFFRLKVAEELNIMLFKVKQPLYERWLENWWKKLKDLNSGDSELLNTVEDKIFEYLKSADPEDAQLLSLGRPVYLNEDKIAFKAEDLFKWLTDIHKMSLTRNQLFFVLRKLKFENVRIKLDENETSTQEDRQRAWVAIPNRYTKNHNKNYKKQNPL